MSIPLTQEERSESALVAFTLLVPASAGVALFALAFGAASDPPSPRSRWRASG